jgi:hypothetical protein
MDERCLPTLTATQVVYHMRVATACAAIGDATRAASEIALAWTLVAPHGWVDSSSDFHDLPMPRSGTDADWDAVESRTAALALEIQSHFVSEGQYALASLYETAAANVRDALAGLRR